ncbi:unnamed protein product [Nyctereutes procyonoides]|uniref:thioredoxin-dependent peroxiredoxin n=1 Tax=Nyctereutes procyonoides TaxID=34880 RepID=A0A811Y0D1_NYCPR|nr:unnamed protein product [Nyctereutes procyonoides]
MFPSGANIGRFVPGFCSPSPAAFQRPWLTNVLWSGSSQTKFTFRTSCSYHGIAIVNREFKDLSLDDFKGKYVVLFFCHLDFIFPSEFHDMNCEVVAVSVVALRGLFIIDPSGGIKHLSVNDLSSLGHGVEETLCLVKVFHLDSPTIMPHPTASTEYFEVVNQ